jgi:tetratricopeptide (TPR) repeat protein
MRNDNHNTIARKIRRRYGALINAPLVAFGLAFCSILWGIPCLCLLAWNRRLPGWEYLDQVTRWLWFGLCFVLIAMLSVMIVAMRKFGYTKPSRNHPLAICLDNFSPLLSMGLTVYALFVGEVNWAALPYFGMQLIADVHPQRRPNRPHLARYSIVLLLGFLCLLNGEVWPAIVCFVLSQFTFLLIKSSLRDVIASKPSREEFVENVLERYQTGAPMMFLLTLDQLCQAEAWEKALELWSREEMQPYLGKNRLTWLARIQLGRRQYNEVLALAEAHDPEQERIEVPLALAHVATGNRQTGLAIARQALKRKREGAEQALGEIYADGGANRQALLWYERAMQLNSKVATWRGAAAALEGMGDLPEACAMWEQAIQRSLFFHWPDLIQWADCRRRMGKDDAQDVLNFAQEKSRPA